VTSPANDEATEVVQPGKEVREEAGVEQRRPLFVRAKVSVEVTSCDGTRLACTAKCNCVGICQPMRHMRTHAAYNRPLM
jgi:hypothetical protein